MSDKVNDTHRPLTRARDVVEVETRSYLRLIWVLRADMALDQTTLYKAVWQKVPLVAGPKEDGVGQTHLSDDRRERTVLLWPLQLFVALWRDLRYCLCPPVTLPPRKLTRSLSLRAEPGHELDQWPPHI